MLDKGVDVLVIEDDADDLSFILRVLRRKYPSLEIEVATQASQALDYIFQTGQYKDRTPYDNPKLILLDLALPKRSDGLEVLRVLKAYTRTHGIPVVVFTSSDEDIDSVDSYRLGVNSYVSKSANFEEFTQAIHNILYYWLEVNRPFPKETETKQPKPASSDTQTITNPFSPRKD